MDRATGPSGTPLAVSFESTNYPGTYLRHQNFRVTQQRYDGSELFRNDASFYQRSGLASAGYSYEAVNLAPGHFIGHSNYQLWIARNDNTPLFRQDASFNQRLALYVEPGDCTSLFRRWRGGYEAEDTMDRCMWIMGIQQYCRAHDAFPATAYDGDRRYLKSRPTLTRTVRSSRSSTSPVASRRVSPTPTSRQRPLSLPSWRPWAAFTAWSTPAPRSRWTLPIGPGLGYRPRPQRP